MIWIQTCDVTECINALAFMHLKLLKNFQNHKNIIIYSIFISESSLEDLNDGLDESFEVNLTNSNQVWCILNTYLHI